MLLIHNAATISNSPFLLQFMITVIHTVHWFVQCYIFCYFTINTNVQAEAMYKLFENVVTKHI